MPSREVGFEHSPIVFCRPAFHARDIRLDRGDEIQKFPPAEPVHHHVPPGPMKLVVIPSLKSAGKRLASIVPRQAAFPE